MHRSTQLNPKVASRRFEITKRFLEDVNVWKKEKVLNVQDTSWYEYQFHET